MEETDKQAFTYVAYRIVELTWDLQADVNYLSVLTSEDMQVPEETYHRFKEHRASMRRFLDLLESQVDGVYQEQQQAMSN